MILLLKLIITIKRIIYNINQKLKAYKKYINRSKYPTIEKHSNNNYGIMYIDL